MIAACIRAARETQHSTMGGSSETEVNEFAVIPCAWSPPAVMTVTPVANWPITSRRPACSDSRGRPVFSLLSTGRSPPESPPAMSRPPAVALAVARTRHVVRRQRVPQLFGHPGGHGGRVGSPHARDALPASGDQPLPLRRQVHVVEGELDLR